MSLLLPSRAGGRATNCHLGRKIRITILGQVFSGGRGAAFCNSVSVFPTPQFVALSMAHFSGMIFFWSFEWWTLFVPPCGKYGKMLSPQICGQPKMGIFPCWRTHFHASALLFWRRGEGRRKGVKQRLSGQIN